MPRKNKTEFKFKRFGRGRPLTTLRVNSKQRPYNSALRCELGYSAGGIGKMFKTAHMAAGGFGGRSFDG